MSDIISNISEYFLRSGVCKENIAIGVSGGADSMALCFALSEYLISENQDTKIHALTVDHGLRAAAADEALFVAVQLSNLKNVNHKILKWQHDKKINARIQESARAARYDLMKNYMRENNIRHLFLAHHMDDQAETFLFRLAKGSGIDGLSCMAQRQEMGRDFILCRPLLEVPKSDLIGFCEENNIKYINDPSNMSDDYARVRIRKSMDILSSEGLSAKRLSISAKRHARARAALDQISKKEFDNNMLEINSKQIVFNLDRLVLLPEEIILRIILRAMDYLGGAGGYGARMNRVESLCSDLATPKSFRKRTLGGVIFECNVKRNTLTLCLEMVG